jgi:heme-degrading monooxygenase HmoA
MLIVIWEYQVKTEKRSEFENKYSSDGAWAELFKKADGYLGTELIRSTEIPRYYITIDRWISSDAYETFLSYWMEEYKILDLHCEGLTHHERYLGRFESR